MEDEEDEERMVMDEVISNDVSALSYRDGGVKWRRRGTAAVKHVTSERAICNARRFHSRRGME